MALSLWALLPAGLPLAGAGRGRGSFRFAEAHPDCWRRGPRDWCCADESESRAECWDDFWNYQRCCVDELELSEVHDDLCFGHDGLVLPEPSRERPFVFLWDEKSGGTTFNDWLLASSAALGKLQNTHISDFGWPNAMGTPFLMKTYNTSRLQSLEIFSGTVDWGIFSVLGCGERRRPSCFVLLRNPVDRFLSYYLERSDRRLEGGDLPLRALAKLSEEELAEYLASIEAQNLRFSGSESGSHCNAENGGLCLRQVEVTEEGGPETLGFRSFLGPQNRLLRMLDPLGSLDRAKHRLARCVVSLQNEDFENHLRVLRVFHPWLQQTSFAGSELGQNSYNRQESAFLRAELPEGHRALIAAFNAKDMELYRQGLEQFYGQVALARSALLLSPAPRQTPPVLYLGSKDWEVNWPFFREKLPSCFFMRRVMRCRITRLASQCSVLVGDSMPEGVDMMLPEGLVEQMIQAVTEEFYRRRPEDFFRLRSSDFQRLTGSSEELRYQQVDIPAYQELLSSAWADAQKLVSAARGHLPQILALAKDPDVEAGCAAVKCLAALGEAKELPVFMEGTLPEVVRAAVLEVGRCPEARRKGACLVKVLQHKAGIGKVLCPGIFKSTPSVSL
ncbi:unnamed protein product [Effrenium voratum]|uniref:Sulfotransferase n=1 Tax=Effrenium voratum TaxID=2562239 RepID=A0AA36HKQ7_9DINO|nr:unnamed protein product [Effrenium voratum]